MGENVVLFGAGVTGRFLMGRMCSVGNPPVAFVDNDPSKQGNEVEGLKILSPEEGVKTYPNALWIPAAMQPNLEVEISDHIKYLGVKYITLWAFLPEGTMNIPLRAYSTIRLLIGDMQSHHELINQIDFRRNPNTDNQLPPSDIKDLYFPEFITHRDDENFVDCGAADGDTIRDFINKWNRYAYITAFEPDTINYRKLTVSCLDDLRHNSVNAAVSDSEGMKDFEETGDYSAHFGHRTGRRVASVTLDDWAVDPGFQTIPTFIKMDIEGAELEAIWGARRILKEHKPVLAICAYHKSDHLWEIPLLIHAIQPEYKLFFRRYSKGDFELVWYAVPPERIVK